MEQHEEVIGAGYTATVIAWGEGKVLKLFNEGFSETVIEKEYRNAMFLREMDFAKPQVHAMVRHNARMGIVYERIRGESLLDWVLRTRDVQGCAIRLAGLHKKVLANQATSLESYKNMLRHHVLMDTTSAAEDREKVLKTLSSLDEGDTLCHGDYHPGNVILSGGKAVVLDFLNICKGPALYDVARTVYLVQYTPVPPVPESREYLLQMKRDLADLYLEQMQVSRSEIRDYLEVVRVARREECPGECS